MTMHVINYDVIIHTLSCVTENVLVTMKPQVGYFLFTINHTGAKPVLGPNYVIPCTWYHTVRTQNELSPMYFQPCTMMFRLSIMY